MRTHDVDPVEIAFDEQRFFFVMRRPGDDVAVGVGDERRAPELDAVPCATWFVFDADAIHRRDEDTVGDRVRAHHRFPRLVLALAILGLLFDEPADRGGIKQNLRPGERREARRFGIPLIPADARAERTVPRVKFLKTRVAWGEVKLFVVPWVVGDVHLAIDAECRAVVVEQHSRVVVQSRRAAFEKRRHEDDLVFLGRSSKRFARRAGDRLGEVEHAMVFGLAEVEAAKEFLQANDLRPGRGRFADPS